MGIACTGVDFRLARLSVAGFDAEARAVAFADFSRCAFHAPRGEQEFVLDAPAVFAILVRAVSHADAHRDFAPVILRRMRVPTDAALLDGPQTVPVSEIFAAGSD